MLQHIRNTRTERHTKEIWDSYLKQKETEKQLKKEKTKQKSKENSNNVKN